MRIILLISFFFFLPLVCLAADGEPVTFIIQVDPDIFDPDTQFQIKIFNLDQLKKAQDTAGCSVSFDVQTGHEKMTCPSGGNPDLPEPEEFLSAVYDLNIPLVIPSRTLEVGQQYRLVISGRYRDKCNTAQASMEGIAETGRIELSEFEWAVTQMACPGPNVPVEPRSPASRSDLKDRGVSSQRDISEESGSSSPGLPGMVTESQNLPE